MPDLTLPALIYQALGQRLELPPTPVTDVVQDHRRVKAGSLFVARRGERRDGHRYAKLAADAGAAAVVGDVPGVSVLPWNHVPYIYVSDDKAALAKLAATFHGRPSKALNVLGITGTDGKTTTAYLLHHLLGSGYKSGLLSTAGNRLGAEPLAQEGHFTTPEAPDVQRALAAFRDGGCTHAVVESSSHGLAQRRLDEVAYDVGIWTNLSPEHLDFHGTLAAYREAKLTLMRRARISVLNRDDAAFAAFAAAAHEVVSYGEHPESDWRASDVHQEAGKQSFVLHSPAGEARVTLPVIGAYNVHNALAALAAAHSAGLSLETLSARLASFPGVPGRMQLVQSEPFTAVVDFAHTPPALEKLLRTLRPLTQGRLIVVLGAAGERDPGKRAPLGEVATRLADLSFFTEEDSRSEVVEHILAEMARGAHAAGGRAAQSYWCLPDRREAIGTALAEAAPGDTVVFAGKGHETTLERAREILPWDEVAEVRRALSLSSE